MSPKPGAEGGADAGADTSADAAAPANAPTAAPAGASPGNAAGPDRGADGDCAADAVATPESAAAARPELLATAGRAQARGQQLLLYTPDGALGGTFTCVGCSAQAWQPDLLDHAPGCPHRAAPAAGRPGRQ